jgi:hypothetical protein
MKLKLTDIVIDEELYPRNQPDWMAVARYIDAARTGSVFPPAVVGKRKDGIYVCLDGRHRLIMWEKLQWPTVPVIVSRVPEKQFFLEAVRLNAMHGRMLSMQERVQSILKLREQGFLDPQISKAINMTVENVRRFVIERTEKIRVGEDRDVIITRKAPVPAGTLTRASDQHNFSVGSQVQLLQQAIALFEHRFIDYDIPDVLHLTRQLHDLITHSLDAVPA